jgi:hypothetical protein
LLRVLISTAQEMAMAKIALRTALLGLAALAACSTYDPYYSSTPTPPRAAAGSPPVAVAPAAPASSGAVPTPPSYRVGYGTVEGVALVHVAPPTASASVGASSRVYPAYRLSVRMQDGSVQSIDQDNRRFMVGDRVQVTDAGRVVLVR